MNAQWPHGWTHVLPEGEPGVCSYLMISSQAIKQVRSRSISSAVNLFCLHNFSQFVLTVICIVFAIETPSARDRPKLATLVKAFSIVARRPLRPTPMARSRSVPT